MSHLPSKGLAALKPDSSLNAAQQRRVFIHLRHADKMLSEIEHTLQAAASKSPFPRYRVDVGPAEGRVVEDHIARIRAQMVRVLEGVGVQPPGADLGARHSIRVTLAFIRVALQEITPKYLVGYGRVPETLVPELEGLSVELQGLVNELDAFLAREPGDDLERKLAALAEDVDEAALARELQRVISAHGLVEYRAPLARLVNRLGTNRFEIAVFGQVSSGKSSLLNHIMGAEILPVGVNPITAVPARLVRGSTPSLRISFADRRVEQYDLGRLSEFATEQGNPGNRKAVTGIVVEYPSPRLREGIVFVDTPGLGSSAISGAQETVSYLPQCDLGVVLVNSATTLTSEDLSTIRSLYEAGIPAMVLLSKADLLVPEERSAAIKYIRGQTRAETGAGAPVDPVSVVGDDERLLHQWFERRISPLYEQHQRLAVESVRRKLGVLAESVEAALRAKLESEGQERRPAEELRKAEHELRTAAGLFPDAERRCRSITDRLRQRAGASLALASRRIVEQWRSDGSAPDAARAVHAAVTETGSAAAGEARSLLDGFAGDLVEALRSTAAVLLVNHVPEPDEFRSALREVPRIDIKVEMADYSLPRPFLVSKRLVRAMAERTLKRAAGARVEEAMVSYGRVLEGWTRRAITELESRFNNHADAYRAQLERLLSETALSPEQRQSIQMDLEKLASLVPGAAPGETERVR